MIDKGQIIFVFKVKWHLKNHFADTVENYRGRLQKFCWSPFSLQDPYSKTETAEEVSPVFKALYYSISISSLHSRAHFFFPNYLKSEFNAKNWNYIYSKHTRSRSTVC